MSNKAVEEAVKTQLGLGVLKDTGISGGGCISSGSAYDTDKHGRVFIKVNEKSEAKTMFTGEFESLKALDAPGIVRVPRPIQIVDLPKGGAALVMEYLDMGGGLSKHAATLGDQHAGIVADTLIYGTPLANRVDPDETAPASNHVTMRLHLHNASLKEKSKLAESSVHKKGDGPVYVDRFGFHVNTCCGYLEMDNTWKDDWPSFYADKVDVQIKMLENKGDREARELWNKILPKFPRFFDGIEIEPALVHGDLWGGNVAENSEGPVIFDPASFYGHHEYDLAIGYLFGGFNSKYYDAYHKVIPMAPGLRKRKDLYKAFHYLNHWNHFGGGYKGSSLSTLQACVKHVYG